MTLDELYLMTADRETLRNGGRRYARMYPATAEERGHVPEFDRSRGGSIAQRIQASLRDIARTLRVSVPEVVAAMRRAGVTGDTERLLIYNQAEAEATRKELGVEFERGKSRRKWSRFVRSLEA